MQSTRTGSPGRQPSSAVQPSGFMPPAARAIPAPLRTPLMHALKLPQLLSMYRQVSTGGSACGEGLKPSGRTADVLALLAARTHDAGELKAPHIFARDALQLLDITLDIRPETQAGLESLPPDQPLVVVSNHPFGVLEGLALMAALLPVRPDTLFLANYLLRSIPEIRELILPVNPFSTRQARRENISGLRAAVGHLRQGGCLCVFPAGEVAHLQPRRRAITDPVWNSNVAGLIRRTGAAVLPLHFEGRNSMLFNLMGLVHPFARTAMLPAELLKKRSSTVTLNVGRIIPPQIFRDLPRETDITAYLRARSYALSRGPKDRQTATAVARRAAPVAGPFPVARLLAEIADLPPEQLLLRENGYLVFEARAWQAPCFLHEIGRQRELTFREVGEGSGEALDTDVFDNRYDHIILWHENDRRLAGAYRIGQTGTVLPEFGVKGLYSSTLFRFSPRFFAQDDNALELGRAFVTAPYQRDYAPLMLLWKGIAHFVLRRPGVRRLFGPVSISLEYSRYSLSALTEFLRLHHQDNTLAAMVSGRKPPRYKMDKRAPDMLNMQGMHFNGLCNLVKDIEGGRTVPVLFKHYLKLGGRIGGFHVDTAFRTLDAFLCIDLADAPPAMLQRYMGREQAVTFLRRCQHSACQISSGR